MLVLLFQLPLLLRPLFHLYTYICLACNAYYIQNMCSINYIYSIIFAHMYIYIYIIIFAAELKHVIELTNIKIH